MKRFVQRNTIIGAWLLAVAPGKGYVGEKVLFLTIQVAANYLA